MADRRHEQANERKRRWLALYELNPTWTRKQVCDQIPTTTKTFYVWLKEDQEFRKRIHEMDTDVRDGSQAVDAYTGSFRDFRKRFFDMDTFWIHQEMVRVLDHAPEGSISLILLPVGIGKTTTLEDWCCQKLAMDPDHRILYVSKSQGEARKRLRRVQMRMTDRTLAPDYIDRFGPFFDPGQEKQGKPWTADYYTVFKRTSGERDYSMAALGWTGQVYGIRADTIILDDIQDIQSLNQTAKMLHWLRQEVMSRRPGGGVKGRIAIIGTRIGPGDLYERLMLEDDLISDGQLVVIPIVNSKGESNCPEMYPDDQLGRLRKQVGEPAWWSAYMQKPHLGESATFTEAMLDQAANPLRKVGHVEDNEQVVIGVDPALVGNTGIVVGAFRGAQLTIVDCLRLERASSQEAILDAIGEMVRRYRPNAVVIETMAYQQALAQDERLTRMSREYGFRVYPHKTYGNKADPTFGVAGIQRSFLMNEIRFPAAETLARNRLEPLIEELRTWRPDIKAKNLQQDMVMAMWFLWLHWMRNRMLPRQEFSGDAFRQRGLRNPTRYQTAGV